MTVYVFDSSAVLRYFGDEAGSERINAIFTDVVRGLAQMRIAAVQWGEVWGYLRRRIGAAPAGRALDSLMPLDLEVVSINAARALRAAELRIDRKIAYADCFALELAMDSAEHVLVTADYDFKTVTDLARIEFLPAK